MQYNCNPSASNFPLEGMHPKQLLRHSYTVPNVVHRHTCVCWCWREVCTIPVAACGSGEVCLSMMGKGWGQGEVPGAMQIK